MSDQRISELKRLVIADGSNEDALLELIKLRAKIEGSDVYLEVLEDRLLWNKVPDLARDLAIAEVSRRLGEAFQWRETKLYECAGVSHSIATLEHLKSGALLNLIPGGTYQMGSPESESWRKEDEGPVHKVTIKAMLIGRYQVSQRVWDKTGGTDERSWKGAKLPIEGVSWKDCKAWLARAGDALRLPSEAEWEYACRAGSTTAFCFGETMTPEQANFDGRGRRGENPGELCREKTVEVGSLPCNAFGLHEVHGNLFEWCEDAWLDNYEDGPYTHLPRCAKSSSEKVLRSGCWGTDAGFCRSACRISGEPLLHHEIIGFRLATSID